ncbi:MAG: Tat pathway signal protein, partial [Betaproteobacteria bacterium]|nr:Tat pathway signal protein [Betaproteobacteria bacterium]
DDVGQGRLLPTTAVDQLAATLASWMGVNTSDLPLVVPNIGNYSVRDLGLMRRT